VTSIDLAQYRLSAIHILPTVECAEASAITFNWTTGTLFVLGDEGDALAEVSLSGQLLSHMTLTGFDDTEGLTYIGGGQFVITEERLQDAYLFTYAAGQTINRASLPTVSLGETVGNIGIEGVSWDPLAEKYIVVKEATPQAVRVADINWTTPSVSVADLFTPALGVLDLSDVQTLTTVPSLIGTADQDNLLIYSQESRRLMVLTRAGAVLSQFDFTAIASNAEGVTIGPDGTIYVVGETPALYVLTVESSNCPADVAPQGELDGEVNVSDLLAVIGSWGACGFCPPVHCPADIAPVVKGQSVGDCQINVSDLLAVIGAWGACQ
jgi:uncharacterized protein YjiK